MRDNTTLCTSLVPSFPALKKAVGFRYRTRFDLPEAMVAAGVTVISTNKAVYGLNQSLQVPSMGHQI
ncbi:hypothetical protein EVAR_6681_1 [Eumeta japonica]|uniref:Uncharacterized protein n=1 Tax=Eumeta variegata TaxID=151549 RepID=A0A4C1TMW3_EUMVA|nr:hypothetical protein EVAR_6681_1 [Eumeta japonica]